MEPLMEDCIINEPPNGDSSHAWGKLLCITPNTPSSVIFCSKLEVVLGRGKESDVRLPNDIRTLSNRHCIVSIGQDHVKENALCAYIMDTSANGTFINGKAITKGQRILLPDEALITLVHPDQDFDKTCVSFRFQSLLPSLTHDYTTHLIQELHKNGLVPVVAQRAHHIASTQQSPTAKNATKKPEQFMHILKVEPTVTNLASLNETLRWCLMHNDKWLQTFISLGGIGVVLDVVSANNKMSRTFEADVFLDFECLKIIDAIVSHPDGINSFISRTDALDEIVLTLLNDGHSPSVKSFVLNLFNVICEYSEGGYRVVISAMERLKNVKREKTRFQFLVQSLITEQDIDYKVKCMTLVNNIIVAAGNSTLNAKHKQEFLNLGCMRILEVLDQEHNEQLSEQLEIFSQQMDKDGIWHRTVNLDDPVSMCKAVQDQIKRDKKASNKFSACLRRLLKICTNTEPNKYEIGMLKSLEIIEKSAGIFACLSWDVHNGNAKEYAHRIDELTKEFTAIRDSIYTPPPPTPPPLPTSETGTESGPGPGTGTGPESGRISDSQNSSESLHSKSELESESGSGSGLESGFIPVSAGPPPPPPPAPPGGAGPPPPPPPPFGSKPPPPPPPGKGPPPLPLKKANVDLPKVPMRQFYWTKVPAPKIKNTVWDPAVDLAQLYASKNVNIDKEPLNSNSNSSNSNSNDSNNNSNKHKHNKSRRGSSSSSNASDKSPTNDQIISSAVKIDSTPVKTDNTVAKTDSTPSTPVNTSPNKISLNKDDLEKLFSAKKTSRGGSTNGKEPAAKEDEQPDKAKEVSLLDMRRCNNIGIGISRFKLTPESVQEELLTLDDAKITKEKVGILLKCTPTADEAGVLLSYKGDAPLAPVEQFLLALLKVPRVSERLDCLQYKLSFDGTVEEIRNSVNSVSRACDALVRDDAFRRLLMVVLQIGNFMNGGSARGDAAGFKINNLLNLSDIKSTDNKSTLLHYIAAHIYQNSPDIFIKCEEMFKYAETASRIVWKEIIAQFELTKSGMAKLHNELVYFKDLVNPDDQFYPVISQFAAEQEPIVEEIGERIKLVDTKFILTAAYFGEEGVSPEDFFVLLTDFNNLFTKAQKDNERERLAAQRADALAEKRKEAMGSPFNSRPTSRRNSVVLFSPPPELNIENIMQNTFVPVSQLDANGENNGEGGSNSNEGSENGGRSRSNSITSQFRKKHAHSNSVDNNSDTDSIDGEVGRSRSNSFVSAGGGSAFQRVSSGDASVNGNGGRSRSNSIDNRANS